MNKHTTFAALAFLVIAVAMVRNTLTLRVRLALIHDKFFGLDGYHLLPSYDAMLFHPRYWGMWRKAQWEQYVLARGLLTGAFRPVATEGKT